MKFSSRIVFGIAVVALLVFSFFFRTWFASHVLPPPKRMQAETTQAYRYALAFSENGTIPSVDSLVMYPDGWPTVQNSIFEEYLAGGMHRVLGGDFNTFMRRFCLAFPLLAAFFLYLWMSAAGYRPGDAAVASVLYSVMLPAMLRARGGSLYRETVAFPLLMALGWLVEGLLGKERSVRRAAAAGIVLFMALAAWKVSAYLVFFLFVYLLWRNWRRNDVPAFIRWWLAGAQLTASLLIPHMRHDGAVLSPASVAAAALLLPPFKTLWFPLLSTILALASAFLGKEAGGHVSAVILAKIRFAFRHPEDPGMLNEDARLFWVPGYTSPGLSQVLLLFGIPVLAALPGLPDFIKTRRHTLIFWFFPVALAGYLFFDRLMIFLAAALVPVIAHTFRRKWTIPVIAAALLLQSSFPSKSAEFVDSLGFHFENSSSLLDDRELDSFLSWLKSETEEDEAVLAFWHLSGLISAYAERPVVTHTFFENSTNRKNIVRFARVMFMPEDSLVSFMREKDCGLVVYQADFLLDDSPTGLSYLAGLTRVPENAAALSMHFHPERLDSLDLVFQGQSIRVFTLDCPVPPKLPAGFLFRERYRHCYTDYDGARAMLSDPKGWSGRLADMGIESNDPDMLSGALLLGLQGGGPADVLKFMLDDLIRLYIQGCYSLENLAEDIRNYTWYQGPDTDLLLLLARLQIAEGETQNAVNVYEEILEIDPGNANAAFELKVMNSSAEERLTRE